MQIVLQDSTSKALESILYLLLVVEAFSLRKSCQDASRSGEQLTKEQVEYGG